MAISLHQPLDEDRVTRKLSGRRVVFVVNDPKFFLSHRKNIALAASAAGAEVYVATPDDKCVAEIRNLGFRHYEIAIDRWGFRPWRELKSILQLYRFYKEADPLLVHHVTIKPVIYGTIAASLAGIPAVVNAVPGLGQVFSSTGLRAAIRRVLVFGLYRIAAINRKASFIFQNPDDRRLFIRRGIISRHRSFLVRGAGVPLDRFTPRAESDGKPLIIFAGRLLRDKGIGEFVEAARLLKGRKIEARFIVVGDTVPGNPASVSEEQMERWRRDSALEFWGMREDMPEIMAAGHLVCLPSYYGEGIPKVLIEAAAAGRAIVATQMPGCREIVEHEVNGLLIPPRDSLALAEAIEELLKDSEKRRGMGEQGRLRVEQNGFSEAAVVQRTLAIYDRQIRIAA